MSNTSSELLASKYTPEQLLQDLPELFKNSIFIPVCSCLVNAGALATTIKSDQLAVAYKDDNTEVTYVDKMLSEYFNLTLPSIFGDFAISEENMSAYPDFDMKTSRCWWLVDPIDGTKGYAQGRQDYCHMVSFIDQGQALITFVYEPELGRIHYAVKGIGVFMVQLDLEAFAYFWQQQQVSKEEFAQLVRQAGTKAYLDAHVTYLHPFKFKRVIHTDTVNTFEYLVNPGTGNDNINLGVTPAYFQYLEQQNQDYFRCLGNAQLMLVKHMRAWRKYAFSQNQQNEEQNPNQQGKSEEANQGTSQETNQKTNQELNFAHYQQTLNFWRQLTNPSLQVNSKAEKTFFSSEFNLNNFRKHFALWSKDRDQQRTEQASQEQTDELQALAQANAQLGYQKNTSSAKAVNADLESLELSNWGLQLEHQSRKLPFYLQAYDLEHLDNDDFKNLVRRLASIFVPQLNQELNLGYGQQKVCLNLHHFPDLNVLAAHNALEHHQRQDLLEHYLTLGNKSVKESQEKKLQFLPEEVKFYARILIHLTAELSAYVSEHPHPRFLINKENKNEAYQSIRLIQGARTQQAFGMFELPYHYQNFSLETFHSAGYKSSLVFATLDNNRLTNYLLPNAMKIWDVAPSLVYAQSSTSPNATVFNLVDINQIPWRTTNIDFSSEDVFPLIMSEDFTSIPFVLDVAGLLYLQLPHLLNFRRQIHQLSVANQRYCSQHPHEQEQFLAQEAQRQLTTAQVIDLGLTSVAKEAWLLSQQSPAQEATQPAQEA
ncbi:inositol monophosphatase family protein [Psittacicella gerlachiana]|uniref:Inositol monophosphatase family protein n=1 Tax=Psittacicella gerlachiana TaxID=2028574 RepID=A0A3A1Y9C1_9GAMM|nr:inositol monophosphatase family protein [Psittacicella gerlachiana]RIY34275.1 hypothetical protein CKF59_05695 [Psittacicella gerlachiana]